MYVYVKQIEDILYDMYSEIVVIHIYVFIDVHVVGRKHNPAQQFPWSDLRRPSELLLRRETTNPAPVHASHHPAGALFLLCT